jgi:hypothetical protein
MFGHSPPFPLALFPCQSLSLLAGGNAEVYRSNRRHYVLTGISRHEKCSRLAWSSSANYMGGLQQSGHSEGTPGESSTYLVLFVAGEQLGLY